MTAWATSLETSGCEELSADSPPAPSLTGCVTWDKPNIPDPSPPIRSYEEPMTCGCRPSSLAFHELQQRQSIVSGMSPGLLPAGGTGKVRAEGHRTNSELCSHLMPQEPNPLRPQSCRPRRKGQIWAPKEPLKGAGRNPVSRTLGKACSPLLTTKILPKEPEIFRNQVLGFCCILFVCFNEDINITRDVSAFGFGFPEGRRKWHLQIPRDSTCPS